MTVAKTEGASEFSKPDSEYQLIKGWADSYTEKGKKSSKSHGK